MIDSREVHPDASTLYGRLLAWFINNVNFCHGYNYDGTEKPENKLYNWLYAHWLWPFVQTDCVCCNTVRGVLYGAVVGYVIGRLV